MKLSKKYYFILADDVSRFCAVLNSSINFIIYCMFGSGESVKNNKIQ
jgi:hypothetical protein